MTHSYNTIQKLISGRQGKVEKTSANPKLPLKSNFHDKKHTKITKSSHESFVRRKLLLYEFFQRASLKDKAYFNEMVKRDIRNNLVYPSQATIAESVDDRGLKTGWRRINSLAKWGVLEKKFRLFNTCIYKVPQELYHPSVRREFEKHCPILKALFSIILLFSMNTSTQSQNVLPGSKTDNYSYNTSTIDRKSIPFYLKIRSFFRKTSKREIIMSNITPLCKSLCITLGLTEYSALLLSMFPDNVLAKAYEGYKNHKGEVLSAVPWLWSRCRTICRNERVSYRYTEVMKEISIAGYRKGDRLTLSDSVTVKKKALQEIPNPPPSASTPPAHENYFLKRFGVPEWVREND